MKFTQISVIKNENEIVVYALNSEGELWEGTKGQSTPGGQLVWAKIESPKSSEFRVREP